MITYTVAQVESLTGISAHSLRVWERRYNFIKPHRTETNIRYYSDKQLKKLINVGILLKHNYKISKVAAMDDNKIHDLISSILLGQQENYQDDIKSLTVSMIDLDEAGFNKLFNTHINKNGLVNTFIQLIYPFLQHVGVLWGINKTMPAQEHFISNLIRQKLISATENLPLARSEAPSLLLYLFEGEDHEIGLLLANYIAKELGWKTYYLGSNVPYENIEIISKQTSPDLLFTMFVSPRKSKFAQAMDDFLKNINTKMLYSGHGDIIKKSQHQNKTHFLQSPEDFRQFLSEYKK
ncbi:MAG: MerR family transcriptional regulator [Reichenbachiella sp.]|uniref:MerR family transcriptional regulator n=1 Tax=Reichenbachiella sp. TaxID=2184521 RepID=UPI0029677793|nr:MerR family transcriptional regulator [Reichenbachiella sp.]MDW3211292.1 MerR family transcriptional regulator [Reichenbachiella sp.]